jgi:hypothetical protein
MSFLVGSFTRKVKKPSRPRIGVRYVLKNALKSGTGAMALARSLGRGEFKGLPGVFCVEGTIGGIVSPPKFAGRTLGCLYA